MRLPRFLLVAALAALVPVGALARPPMETNQLVDDNGAPLGVSANPLIAAAAPDGVTTSYALTGTGSTIGLRTAGYGSVVVDLGGTFVGTVNAEFSTDSTDCVSDGTWYGGFGFTPDNAGTISPAAAMTVSTRRREFRATDGHCVRLNVTSYTSGTINATLTRRTAPIGERAVFVGGGSINPTLASAGTNRSATVGTTAANLMASNTSRRGYKVKNDCANAIWINLFTTATAVAGSGNIKIPAGGGYYASEPGFVETGAMSAIAETSSCAITASEH